MITPKACLSVLAALFMFLMFDVAVMGQTKVSPAQDIVFKMAERYAALSSYQDSGVVEIVTEGPLARRGTDIYFKTNFTKPNKLRFEWIDYVSLASFERNAIWSDGTKASAFYSYEDHVETKEDVGMAVAGATGVSQSSAYTVPRLLISEIDGFSLTELEKLTLKKQEVFEGEECYVIEGYHWNKEAWQLWISTKDFLLRKLRTPSLKDEFQEEIHREIRINDKIAEETYQPKVANRRIVNTITKEKEADLQKLLKFLEPRDRINDQLNELVKLLKLGWPQVTDKAWQEMFTEVRFDADAVLEIYVSVYDWHYTADEIKQLINLYESPLGRKLSKAEDLVQLEATRRGQAIGREMLKLIQERLKAKGYKSAA